MSKGRGGRGSVQERSPGRWRIRASQVDPETGERAWWTETVRGSRTAAQRRLTELLHEIDTGARSDPRRMTLGTYLRDEWFSGVCRVARGDHELAPTTRAKYAGAVQRISQTIGDIRLAELRARHVELLRDKLLERLAPQTAGDILRILSQALRKAAGRGLVAKNPADAGVVNRPSGRPKKPRIISPDLATAILRTVRGTDPWDVAAHLALGVTLRREEILGLRWEDVDIEAQTLSVRHTLTFADGQAHEGGPKSAAGERTIQLPSFVAEALRRHHRAQGERRLIVGEAWQGDHVVDRGDGEPISPPSFSKAWSRFAARHGFGDLTLHSLRHGAASLLLAAGVPDPVAINIMGHGDTRILRRYQDVVDELKQDAARRMDGLLGAEG